MDFSDLVHCFTNRSAAKINADVALSEAAVAVIFRQQSDAVLELLLIRRAEFAGDRWSGQMGLPGGKRNNQDETIQSTAMRETMEEVGIDLMKNSQFFGFSDEIRAVAKGQELPIVITPCVFGWLGNGELQLSSEVHSHYWIDVEKLRAKENRSSFLYEHPSGNYQLPCIPLTEPPIWGLTLRMLDRLFEILDESQQR